jgi:hypothetical protein
MDILRFQKPPAILAIPLNVYGFSDCGKSNHDDMELSGSVKGGFEHPRMQVEARA